MAEALFFDVYTSESRYKIHKNELKLNSADELVNDMYKEYCKYSKLLELAKKDRIEVIKDTVRYMYYSEKLLTSAQKWIHMRDDKSLDKRKKYEEKEDFEYLQNILREEVFKNPSLEITSIKFPQNMDDRIFIDYQYISKG